LFAPPLASGQTSPYTDEWRFAQSLYGMLSGQVGWGAPVYMTSLNGDSGLPVTQTAVKNGGSGDDNFQLTVKNNGSGGHINVPGVFDVKDGGVSASYLGVSQDLYVAGDSNLSGDVHVGAQLSVAGLATFADDVSMQGALTVVGPLDGSVIHLTGAASPNDALDIVAGDIRLQAGNFQAANNYGLVLAPATVPIVKMDTSNNFLLGNVAYDTKIYGLSTTLYDHTNTAQLIVMPSGPPGLRVGHVGFGADPSATDMLTVVGSSSFTGTATVQSGGLHVVAGGLAVDLGGIQVTGNSMITGLTTLFGDVSIGASTASLLGFYAHTGIPKQTISGSRGGNVALANVLTVLDSLGLITNSTTA